MFYCFIVNKVRYETRAEPMRFKGISSTYFRNFIGSGYRRYIDQLYQWDIIRDTDGYLAANGYGYPKAYRLHRDILNSPLVKITFAKKKAQPLDDRSVLDDDITPFVWANCKRIGIKTDLAVQGSVADDVDAEDFAERIFCDQHNIHYGRKVVRLYHTIIEMPSAARANLMLKEKPGTPLFEYDVKSCHPVLMLQLMEEAEKAALMELLSGDFYRTVATECGRQHRNRDLIKKDFVTFANGKRRNYFHRYFRTHFPRLTAYLDEHKDGVAAFGQNGEAVIMVDEVPRWLMSVAGSAAPKPLNNTELKEWYLTCWGKSQDLLYIPMHDGWLGIERDEIRIANYVRDRFYEYTQFWVTITKTNLATGKETNLLKGRPEIPLEQMTHYR